MILGSEPWGYASKRMRQALMRNGLPERPAGGFGVCAGYAPDEILSGLAEAILDDIGIRALGVCVEAYAPGSNAQLTSRNTRWRLWGMRWICAGRHSGWSLECGSWMAFGLHLVTSNRPYDIQRGMRRGYAPYIYMRKVTFFILIFGGYAPRYAPYIFIYILKKQKTNM